MIYLDYNATTPVDDYVVDAMMPYLKVHHGNPSSGHAFGQTTAAAIDTARRQVASLIGALPEEIVFTSGGTEANNFVLKGRFFRHEHPQDCHIITSAVEHPAILMPCRFLQQLGCKVTEVPVDVTGLVDPDDVNNAITPQTTLISIMHANNEVGTIQPLNDIAKVAHRAGVPFHTDAAQTVGKIPTNVDELGVDFLSIAAHKLYAPAGAGALYIRAGQSLEPLLHGAGHEKGRRAGTEPTANLVALGAAAQLAQKDLLGAKTRTLCARFHNLLRNALGERVVLNGHHDQRLPNTLNIGFKGLLGPDLLKRLDGIAASPGAACHFDRHEPSYVLAAMNVPRDVALGAIRFSLGRPTTEAEIDSAANQIITTINTI